MKHSLLLTTICAGAFLLSSGALAQAPGGGAGGAGGGQMPAQRPSANGPMDTGTQAPAAPKAVDDRKFLKDAALGGMTEVQLGQLAQQKASSDQVKQFAQKMIDDHTKANDQLKELATRGSIDIPTALDSKHQSRIDKLSKLSGEQFDKAYVKDAVKDHQADVKEFSDEAQNGTEPHVKAFASSTLPTLQQHLEMAKNLSKTEKGK